MTERWLCAVRGVCMKCLTLTLKLLRLFANSTPVCRKIENPCVANIQRGWTGHVSNEISFLAIVYILRCAINFFVSPMMFGNNQNDALFRLYAIISVRDQLNLLIRISCGMCLSNLQVFTGQQLYTYTIKSAPIGRTHQPIYY